MTDLTTRLAELKADMDEVRDTWGTDDHLLIGSQSEIAGLRSHVLALIAAVEGVVAVHRRAHAVFSWQTGSSRYEDPCPDCDGKAGVHDCGCWADSDIEYVCAECHRLGSRASGVYDYTWPCATVRAVTTALGIEDGA